MSIVLFVNEKKNTPKSFEIVKEIKPVTTFIDVLIFV